MYSHKNIPRHPSVMDRVTGFSDEMMYNQAKLLHGIVFATKKQKVGRGKNAKFIEVRRYEVDEEVDKRAIHSLEYYKNKMKDQTKIKFRDYQNKIIVKGAEILIVKGMLYLTMEVRTGKTLTSLGIARLMNKSSVLFVTKKKAIGSIEKDYQALKPDFDIVVINYESLHKVEGEFDLIILDEAHSMGAFPKDYVNFYKFSKQYVNVKQRKINSLYINDYHDGLKTIIDEMKPYTISYSQKEAGFKVDTREHILEVDVEPITKKLTAQLKKDRVVQGKEEVILGDTPVKLMMKLHQLYSGTVKFESGNSTIIDYSKAQFIHDNFADVKIGIFYKFKEELNALKKIYGDQLCTELEEFDTTSKSIALQIVSGREGISLRKADALVYYNIDFSATSYWQSRDRMTTKDRLESDVYWIFAKGGIEKDIYKAVSKKKDYTVSHFKRDLLS